MRNYMINYLKRGGIVILLLANLLYGAQAQSYDEIITNLESQIKEYTVQDTQRVNILNKLSYAYRRNDPIKIDSFARAALQLSEQLNYAKGKGIAYKNLAIGQHKLSGSVAEIMEFLKKAIFWAKAANDHYTEIACMNNLGLSYQAKFAYDKAIGIMQKALELHKEHLPENRLKLLLLGNLGDIYLKLEDFQNARKYYDELIIVAGNLKDEKTVLLHTETQALLLFKLKEPAQAVQLIEASLPKLKEYGDYQSIVKTQIILSNILLEKEAFQEAHEVLKEAQVNIKKYNLKIEQCGIFLNLMKIYLAEKKILKAKEVGIKALECAEESPDSYLKLMTAKYLVQVFHANKDVAKATELFALYDDLQKEYSDVQKQKTYIKTELAYQVKQQEVENAVLLAKQQESEATIRSQERFNTSLIALILLSFILIGLAVRAYFQKQKQNKILDQKVLERTAALDESNKELIQSNNKLAQSNQELEKFAYIASHDLKQPLCTIVNFSKLLSKEVEHSPNPESKLYLQHILNSGGRMMNLIEDVLEYSKLDKKNQKFTTIDLNQLVREIEVMLGAYITKKNAQIQITNSLPSLKYDKTQLMMVFKNLIENGIKYNTSPAPTIIINSQQGKDFLKISFQDNGIGIEEEYHHKLFQMFSRLQNHKDYEGTGLGLSMCKKVVDSMGGEIGIATDTQSGSLFYVDIPITMMVGVEESAKELSLA